MPLTFICTFMKNRNIILIEDNIDDAELATISLSSLNIIDNVLHLSDGEEALEYLFATGRFSDRDIQDIPSMILLDLKMPKLSGIEVLSRIRLDNRFKFVPIIVFSSSNEHKDIADCLGYGANSYIQKPVDGDEFDRTLKDIGNYWLRYNKYPEV